MSVARKPSATAPSNLDRAYAEMKRRILNNVWPPGYSEFLPEVAIALGMSRTPVREALLRLESEGLVEIVPRRGMRVVPLSASDMRDIYDVLASLEATAAELLAAHPDREERTREMAETVDDLDRALAENDLERWAGGDARFHRLLVERCGNKRLSDLASTISDQAHRARMITLGLRESPAASNTDHRSIVDLIRSGAVEAAGALAKRHRRTGRDMLLALLEKTQLAQI